MIDNLIVDTAKELKNNNFEVYTWLFRNIYPKLRRLVSLSMFDIPLAEDIYHEILAQLLEDFENNKLEPNERTDYYFYRECRIHIQQEFSRRKGIGAEDSAKSIIDLDEYKKCWEVPENYKYADDFTRVDLLYKFMPLNQFTYNVVINRELWYSNPFNFNDPFDCSLKIVESDNIESFAENSKLNGKIKSELSKIGVTCFSKDYHNILMWSHYADSHKGICLVFDYQKDINFFNPFEIIYTHEYPDIHDKLNKHDLIKKLIYTKSDNWHYEKEVRSIKSKWGTYKFAPEVLCGIILGHKTTNDDLKTIQNIIDLRYEDIDIYKMVKSENRFEIEKELITTTNKPQ